MAERTPVSDPSLPATTAPAAAVPDKRTPPPRGAFRCINGHYSADRVGKMVDRCPWCGAWSYPTPQAEASRMAVTGKDKA